MKKLTELEKIERQTQVGTLVMIILWCIAIVGIIFLFHKFELF